MLKKRVEDVMDGEELLKLPGVRKGDVGMKSSAPEAGLRSIALSPTGDQLALVSSTSVDIWRSGNESTQTTINFAPITLDVDTTPEKVEHSILQRDYAKALKTSLALNSAVLIRNSIETFASKQAGADPTGMIRLLLAQLSTQEVTLLMDFVGSELKNTRHLQFYLVLAQSIVLYFGVNLKSNKPLALCTKLQKSLLDRRNLLMRLFEENSSRIDYLLDMKQLNCGEAESAENSGGEMDDEELSEDEEILMA